MDLQKVLAAYDQELRIDIEYPGMEKEVLPQVVRFVRPAPGMSFILYSQLDSMNADAVIQEQIAYFRQHDGPFEWKLYAHDTPSDLKERIESAGFEPEDQDVVMVLDVQGAPPVLLAPVITDVRQITAREQLHEVIVVLEAVWGGNFGWIPERLGDHLAIPNYLSVYVAYVEDQPAAAAWTYFYPNSQFAGLWAGSTVEQYRQRGLYTALLATRVQEALRRGYRYLTIDAGHMSQPIVARHGFKVLTYAYACEWQGKAMT